jgi:hypothetical protein
MTAGNGMDLLAVTPERFRQALRRSFLRHGISGELDTAVHAAMNVFAPVLEARDAEITRLNQTLARVKPRARSRARSARAGDTVGAGRGPRRSRTDPLLVGRAIEPT